MQKKSRLRSVAGQKALRELAAGAKVENGFSFSKAADRLLHRPV